MPKITFRRFLKYLLLLPVSPVLLVWWLLRMLWRGWCMFVKALGFKRIDSYILTKFLTTYIFLIVVGLFLLSKIWKLIKRFRRFLREGVKKVV